MSPPVDHSSIAEPKRGRWSPAFKWTMIAVGAVLSLVLLFSLAFFLLMASYGRNP